MSCWRIVFITALTHLTICVLSTPVAVAQTVIRGEDLRQIDQPALTGLYPVWENNGLLRAHRHFAFSYNNASIGLGNIIQLGIRPSSFIFRMPNTYAKIKLLDRARWGVTVQSGVLVMLPGAGNSFLSSTYASSLSNPDFTVVAVPTTVSVTVKLASWAYIHNATTLLGVIGQAPVKNNAIVGNYITAEFVALKYHAVYSHLGEIGFWDHRMTIFGVSYRFHYDWFEARIGYAYRYSPDGWQGQPLFDIGVVY